MFKQRGTPLFKLRYHHLQYMHDSIAYKTIPKYKVLKQFSWNIIALVSKAEMANVPPCPELHKYEHSVPQQSLS